MGETFSLYENLVEHCKQLKQGKKIADYKIERTLTGYEIKYLPIKIRPKQMIPIEFLESGEVKKYG